MEKKPRGYIPSRPLVRLPESLSLGDIDHLFAEAIRQVGTKLEVCWASSDKSTDFLVTVFLCNKTVEAQWEFFQGVDKDAAPLWSYITSDILLVFNLIASSMQSVEYRNAASGKRIKATDGYSDIYQIPDAYYRSALDLLAQEQQKLSLMTGASGAKAPITNIWTGDVSQIAVGNVMQAIMGSNMTGRLRLTTSTSDAEIYFDNGEPIHAVRGMLKGDECLLSLLTYNDGTFRFEPDILPDKKTIRQKASVLMLKGALLRDKMQYLYNAGLQPDSLLVRKRQDLAEAEFEAISASVASGSHLSFSMLAQKQFYGAVDGQRTLSQLTEKLKLTASQWIPLLCRMLKADFVEIVNSAQKQPSENELDRKMIDRHAIHSVMMSLRRAQTGMYTYPAFLYFLEQESLKHYRVSKPLSVAIVELRIGGGDYEYRSPLPVNLLSECIRRISSLKRDSDFLAHYEIFDMAIILPDTDSDGAAIFARRIIKELHTPEVVCEKDAELLIAIGTATIPSDVSDIGFLLSAAEKARNAAQHSNDAVVKYSELQPKHVAAKL
jgi:GGDEF domain-containing protein